MTGPLKTTRREAFAATTALLLLPSCATGWQATGPRFVRRSVDVATDDGRKMEVAVWEPSGRTEGLIAFSHGWGGSPDGCLRLIEPLAAAGWRVLAPLHTDSPRHPDYASFTFEGSWGQRMHDMRALSLHLGDVSYVAAGHSYGALTALVLGGVGATVPEGLGPDLRDPKVIAAIAFSPPLPLAGFVDRDDFAQLAVPALIQTGTLDDPTFEGGKGQTWQARLTAYEAAAPGNSRYALVLEGVDHNFGGGIGAELSDPGPLQDRQLDEAAAIAELFARAYGLVDNRAERALAARLSDSYPARLIRR